MLQIKSEQTLDYASIFSSRTETLRLVKIMLEGLSSRPKSLYKKKQDVFELLTKHGFEKSEIEELINAADQSNKVVSVVKLNEKSKAYKNIKSHVDFLHNHDNALKNSWITVAHIDYKLAEDGWHQWHYRSSDVVDQLASLRSKKTNTYMSVNEFWSPYRNVLSLRYITAFYVDIDAHDGESFDLKAVKKFLNKKYKDGILPRHSKLSFTGRGVQIYWKIELSPASNLWLWQIIEKYIIEALSDIKDHIKGHKVDTNCSDITRVFRVDDTWNLRSKCYSKNIEQNDNVYRMNQILEDYFKDKYILKKKKKEEKLKDAQLKAESKEKAENENSDESKDKEYVLELTEQKEAKFRIMRQRRVNDLKTLLELRKFNLSKGHREYFLYIYAWTAVENITSETMIYNELSSVNQMFYDQLTNNEVRGIARRVFRKWSSRSLKNTAKDNTWSKLTGRYCFRNTTIIEKLGITDAERENFETIFKDKEEAERIAYSKRRNEKKRNDRRNENGLTKREQAKEDNLNRVRELMTQGLKQKDIVEATELSKGQVSKLVKQIKTEG